MFDKRMKLVGCAAITAIAFSFASPAAAAPVMKCQQKFETADRNDDGTVSKSELAMIDQTYAELNKNGDGKITQADFRDCIAGIFQRQRKFGK